MQIKNRTYFVRGLLVFAGYLSVLMCRYENNNNGVNSMKVYGFPGQGSQVRGMGTGLFDLYPDYVSQADEILGYSIKELCLEDPQKRLGKTEYTQPALYVVGVLAYLHQLESDRCPPDFLLGHSLGEYCALHISGAFSFGDGLKMVQKRGALMSKVSGGGMAASIGCDAEKVSNILKQNNLGDIEIANYNSPKQLVISGRREDVFDAAPAFEDAGATYIPLNVSAAFHSKFMLPVAREFEEFLLTFKMSPLKIPVISNVYAKPYENNKVVSTLAKQIGAAVLWADSIRYLMGRNDPEGDFEFQEIGVGTVLTKLVKKIQSEPIPEFPGKPHGFATDAPNEKESSLVVIEAEKVSSSNATRSADVVSKGFGSEQFKKDYNLCYAYMSGSMCRGIASEDLVVRMAKSGFLAIFGSGGMSADLVDSSIKKIKSALAGKDLSEKNTEKKIFGVNLSHKPSNSVAEMALVNVFLSNKVRCVEASQFIEITPALVKFRLSGLSVTTSGSVEAQNKIIAKVSRPEMAQEFLRPAPNSIVQQLLLDREITQLQAQLSEKIPMADDLCAQADCGGDTDLGFGCVLLPAVKRIRDRLCREYGYDKLVRVGSAGGIGTPEAVASAFILGSDFVVTGSINQCTVEAGTSVAVKDMLQDMDIQDTEYVPSVDAFEMDRRIQVLSRGVLFPIRARKLYELWNRYGGIEEIDDETRDFIEVAYFKNTFSDVVDQASILADKNSARDKMALVFKEYFLRAWEMAVSGNPEEKADFQVHTGPAMGAFNQWVKGSDIENWRNRHVDVIAKRLMVGAAEYLDSIQVGKSVV